MHGVRSIDRARVETNDGSTPGQAHKTLVHSVLLGFLSRIDTQRADTSAKIVSLLRDTYNSVCNQDNNITDMIHIIQEC